MCSYQHHSIVSCTRETVGWERLGTVGSCSILSPNLNHTYLALDSVAEISREASREDSRTCLRLSTSEWDSPISHLRHSRPPAVTTPLALPDTLPLEAASPSPGIGGNQLVCHRSSLRRAPAWDRHRRAFRSAPRSASPASPAHMLTGDTSELPSVDCIAVSATLINQ